MDSGGARAVPGGADRRHEGDDLFATYPVDGSSVDHLYRKSMSDQLQELSVFVRAAETGSFSKTAREFSLSQPSVSRMVASLEARLGVKLLLRTTRRVTPTDARAVFLERTRRVLGDLDEAAHAARGRQPPRCAARRHVRRVRHPRSDSAPAAAPGASAAGESRVRYARSDRRPGGR